MMKLANRGGASQDGGFHGGGGDLCHKKWFGIFARRLDATPSDSISNMLSENLVHLEISDKFSVFYRIIDFYAFLHTVAKRDLIRRPIV